MIIDGQDAHWQCARLSTSISLRNRRHRVAAILAAERRCCTLRLDSRRFCLSTLPRRETGNEFALRQTLFRSWTNNMWQKLSLRARVNLLLAIVLALGLTINVGRLVLEAGPRV